MKAPEPLATSPKEMVPVMPLDLSLSGSEGAETGGVNRHGGGADFCTVRFSFLRWRFERLEGAVAAARSASSGSATKTAPCPTTQCRSAFAKCLSLSPWASAIAWSFLTSSAKPSPVSVVSSAAASWCCGRCRLFFALGPCLDCSHLQKLVANAISSAIVAIHGGALPPPRLLSSSHCVPVPVCCSCGASSGASKALEAATSGVASAVGIDTLEGRPIIS